MRTHADIMRTLCGHIQTQHKNADTCGQLRTQVQTAGLKTKNTMAHEAAPQNYHNYSGSSTTRPPPSSLRAHCRLFCVSIFIRRLLLRAQS
eukprot:scaffold13727_cov52-Cyclotella_meneghiniana.AAC.2